MKRLLDFIVAFLALLLMWPVIFMLTALIRHQLGSPALFRQVRPGLHGHPFELCKFRSMGYACDEKGDLLPDSERLGKFGRLLRRSSLDELPQLWNVLKGDMSLVGPRPLLMEYLPLYSHEQARRQEVRPGITGWAQVNGRNAISWEEKFRLDVWYVDNQSFWLDLKILALTIKQVLLRLGVSAPGEATMAKFKGNS